MSAETLAKIARIREIAVRLHIPKLVDDCDNALGKRTKRGPDTVNRPSTSAKKENSFLFSATGEERANPVKREEAPSK